MEFKNTRLSKKVVASKVHSESDEGLYRDAGLLPVNLI